MIELFDVRHPQQRTMLQPQLAESAVEVVVKIGMESFLAKLRRRTIALAFAAALPPTITAWQAVDVANRRITLLRRAAYSVQAAAHRA